MSKTRLNGKNDRACEYEMMMMMMMKTRATDDNSHRGCVLFLFVSLSMHILIK
jgi:hypothetical protein